MSDELQAEVRAAMEEVAAKEPQVAEEVAAAAKLEPEAKIEVKDPEAKTEVKEPEAKESEEAKILTEDKAPRGWSPAAREKWSTIPEDLRKEIIRREDASAAGVRQLQERYAPQEQFVQGLASFIQEAHQHGVMADQYIGGVMTSERTLRTADVPGKFQEILRIADQYGVPLRDIINESVGQKIIPPAQQQQQQFQLPPQLEQEIMEMRQWREQQQGGQVNTQIAEFAKGNEFFNDVHQKMAVLIDSGDANDLASAYEMACWATPEVRDIMLQRQGLQKKQEVAAGASINPMGGADLQGGEADSDDLAAVVRQAYIRSSSGRL